MQHKSENLKFWRGFFLGLKCICDWKISVERLSGYCSGDRLRTLFAIMNINPSEFISSCFIRCNIDVICVGGQQSFVSFDVWTSQLPILSDENDVEKRGVAFICENIQQRTIFSTDETFNKQAAFMNFNFLSAYYLQRYDDYWRIWVRTLLNKFNVQRLFIKTWNEFCLVIREFKI